MKTILVFMIGMLLVGCGSSGGGGDTDAGKTSGETSVKTGKDKDKDSTTGETTAKTSYETVEYKATIKTIWSKENFATNFPNGRHFSPVIGMTHNENIKLFSVDSKATNGIKEMAETGKTDKTKSEIKDYVGSKNAGLLIKGSSLSSSTDTTSFNFKISSNHSLISIVSMIAPSPDWFIGINSLNLMENEEWVKEKIIDLKVYDSGTDSGDIFTSSNKATSPQANITRLSTPSSDTDFQDGKHRTSNKFIASITITKVENIAVNTFNAKKYFQGNCTTCHGSNGKGSTNIQGRGEATYNSILSSFQDGSRTSPSGMSAKLKGFDVDNLKALAKYIATL